MLVIGIAGGTGSGKTTVVNKILQGLNAEGVNVLSQDNYYHDNQHLSLNEREALNYDHPKSIDFELLLNINGREIFNKNYNLAEKCLFKMEKISNTTYHEIQVVSNLLGLYVLPFFEENIMKYEEVNILIDKYEKLIKNSPEHNIQLLESRLQIPPS